MVVGWHNLITVRPHSLTNVLLFLLLLLLLIAGDCGANEFQCKSDHLCIPLARVADGQRDCADGEDECDNENQFRCRCGSPVCIDRVHVLDGQIHCEDGSDEGLESTGAGCMSNELSAGKYFNFFFCLLFSISILSNIPPP